MKSIREPYPFSSIRKSHVLRWWRCFELTFSEVVAYFDDAPYVGDKNRAPLGNVQHVRLQGVEGALVVTPEWITYEFEDEDDFFRNDRQGFLYNCVEEALHDTHIMSRRRNRGRARLLLALNLVVISAVLYLINPAAVAASAVIFLLCWFHDEPFLHASLFGMLWGFAGVAFYLQCFDGYGVAAALALIPAVLVGWLTLAGLNDAARQET